MSNLRNMLQVKMFGQIVTILKLKKVANLKPNLVLNKKLGW